MRRSPGIRKRSRARRARMSAPRSLLRTRRSVVAARRRSSSWRLAMRPSCRSAGATSPSWRRSPPTRTVRLGLSWICSSRSCVTGTRLRGRSAPQRRRGRHERRAHTAHHSTRRPGSVYGWTRRQRDGADRRGAGAPADPHRRAGLHRASRRTSCAGRAGRRDDTRSGGARLHSGDTCGDRAVRGGTLHQLECHGLRAILRRRPLRTVRGRRWSPSTSRRASWRSNVARGLWPATGLSAR